VPPTCSATQAFGIGGTVVSQAWVKLAACAQAVPPTFSAAVKQDFTNRCIAAGGQSLVGCDGNPYCTCQIDPASGTNPNTLP
jgi:hypothetical protein